MFRGGCGVGAGGHWLLMRRQRMCWRRRWRRTGSWCCLWRSCGRRTPGCARRPRSVNAELEQVKAALAVLQRMVFGGSSERSRPGRDPGWDGGGGRAAGTGRRAPERGPGARAGRRDWSHLPRVEVIRDFEDGGYWCPQCGTSFTRLGDHVVEAAGLGGDRPGGGALPPPVPAGLPVPGPGDGDGARPVEGDRQGPVVQRVHRDAADRAVRGRAEPELAGDRAGPARRGGLAGDAGRGVRAGGSAAGPAGGGDHRAVAGLVAPARR